MFSRLFTTTFILIIFITFSEFASAQCESWEAHPNGKESAMEMHVNYRRLFDAKKYDEAFKIWTDLFQYVKSPKESKTIHFKDGINMYKAFAKSEKDKAKKDEHVTAMMDLYDQMAKCIGEKASDRAREGYNIYAVRGNSEKALDMFKKAVELGENKTPNLVLIPMAQLSVYMFQQNNPAYTVDYMRGLYTQLENIVKYNIDNKTKDASKYEEKWVKVVEEFKKIGDNIWGCDFHVGEWKGKFEADKFNMEQNEKILSILKSKCGVDNELYIAVNDVYAPWKQRRDDSIAEANFQLLCNFKKGEYLERKSLIARKKGDENEADSLKEIAFEWYTKSLNDDSSENCEVTNEEKGDLAYRLADALYRKGSYSEARSLCYKAVEYKSGWGKPYMLIGTMYASSGKRCSGGSGTGWDAQVVAWAAIDMWSKAKSVDSSLSDDANSKIAKYRKYLPTKGDIFQRGLKENGTYQIGCWIGVSTKIRAATE